MPARLFLQGDQPWVDWGWLSAHVPYVWAAVEQHIELTVIAVVVGLAIALVLGVLAHLWRPLRFPVLTLFGAFYTIPSIALFAILIPITGVSGTSAEIPLIGYNVLILVRNVMVGLDSVPADVLDAADGMGYRRFARLIGVEVPLALPAIFAGLRVAVVSTIGIVTITAVIGLGGLGQLILRGLIQDFRTPLVVATAICIVIALVSDVALAGVQRIVVPWVRNA